MPFSKSDHLKSLAQAVRRLEYEVRRQGDFHNTTAVKQDYIEIFSLRQKQGVDKQVEATCQRVEELLLRIYTNEIRTYLKRNVGGEQLPDAQAARRCLGELKDTLGETHRVTHYSDVLKELGTKVLEGERELREKLSALRQSEPEPYSLEGKLREILSVCKTDLVVKSRGPCVQCRFGMKTRLPSGVQVAMDCLIKRDLVKYLVATHQRLAQLALKDKELQKKLQSLNQGEAPRGAPRGAIDCCEAVYSLMLHRASLQSQQKDIEERIEFYYQKYINLK